MQMTAFVYSFAFSSINEALIFLTHACLFRSDGQKRANQKDEPFPVYIPGSALSDIVIVPRKHKQMEVVCVVVVFFFFWDANFQRSVEKKNQQHTQHQNRTYLLTERRPW